jgi:hypothetical protein
MPDDLELFLRVGIAGLALLLLAVSAASWARLRTAKVGLLVLTFGLFAAKGILLVLEGLGRSAGLGTAAWLGLDFAALAVLYLAVVR